jgi:maltooligosyltrehalose trehalohydrolase
MITPVAEGGLGMSAQWADDVHHALHVALTGETQGYYADFADPGALAKTLTGAFFHDGTHSTFRGRPWGAPVDRATIRGHRFVAYLQTHDQVGNRATGDRIGATITAGQQAAGAALYLLSAFTPMVFMGEEWAASTPWQYFTDFQDPEMGRAVSEGRRAEFAEHGWAEGEVPDPQEESTRDASVLRWDEIDSVENGGEHGGGEHRAMLDWYRRLIALRRSEPDLADSDLAAVAVERDVEAGWVVMRRGAFRVVANLAAEEVQVPLEGTLAEVTAAFGDVTGGPEGAHTLRMGGHSVAVVRTA